MKERKINIKKDERGSVTLFVLVVMMFTTAMLFLGYSRHMNQINEQKKQIDAIQKQYSGEDINIIYEEVNNM